MSTPDYAPPCSVCSPELWAAWLRQYGEPADQQYPYRCFAHQLVREVAKANPTFNQRVARGRAKER